MVGLMRSTQQLSSITSCVSLPGALTGNGRALLRPGPRGAVHLKVQTPQFGEDGLRRSAHQIPNVVNMAAAGEVRVTAQLGRLIACRGPLP